MNFSIRLNPKDMTFDQTMVIFFYFNLMIWQRDKEARKFFFLKKKKVQNFMKTGRGKII